MTNALIWMGWYGMGYGYENIAARLAMWNRDWIVQESGHEYTERDIYISPVGI